MSATRKRSITWTVFNIESQSLVCERCGCKWPITFPLSATAMVGLCRVFEAEHRVCLEPKGAGA